MESSRLKIGVAGARWLGVECLKFLSSLSDVKISHVCFPKRAGRAWWRDVVDEDEVEKLGYKITPWGKWRDLNFDLVFSILHGKIFKKNHIENCRYGIINLHPAPLPEYRGRNSYAHAIMNGDKTYRVSLHYIEEGIDSGRILGERTLPIKIEDTGRDLYDRAQKVAFELFKNKVPIILKNARFGKLTRARIQDESRARYYPRTSLDDKKVDLSRPPREVYNFVRALDFSPFEPAFTVINGKKVYLTVKNPRSF